MPLMTNEQMAMLEKKSYTNAVANSTDGHVTKISAWECVGPKFSGIVYTQEIALDKMSQGCDIQLIHLYRPVTRKDEY